MLKLSIIVPVYNVENYLPRCLDSILAQTMKDFEVICVNDGSKDSSLSILQDYATKDNRIKIVDQENQGLGCARNAGIERAVGEYLGFVDSDDFIAPEMYEELIKKADKNNSDIVLSNVYLYYTNSGGTSVFRDEQFYEAMSRAEVFNAFEHPKIYQFIGVWDRIYRRSFIETNHLRNPEKRIYEDVLFTVQTLTYAKRISVVNSPFYYYRKNTGVSIVDKEVATDSYKFDFLKNLKESLSFLKESGKYELVGRDFLAFQLTGIVFHQKNMQSRKSFIRFMSELHDFLTDFDMKLLDLSANHFYAKVYLQLLKKKRYHTAYILIKFSKLFKIDKYYYYFRLPRTKSYHRIKRPGFRWKVEMDLKRELIFEIRQLREQLDSDK